MSGDSAASLGITGHEKFNIAGLDDTISPDSIVEIQMVRDDMSMVNFMAVRLNAYPIEVDYYRNGGVLNTVLAICFQSKEIRHQ
jgi:aconitate hydratase